MTALRRGGWQEVRQLAASLVKPLESEPCSLDAAVGRVLAGNARSTIDLPTADVSAMDGWAVSGVGPWMICGRIVNGTNLMQSLAAGQACSIGTGGVVPEGTTAILRREHGQLCDGLLTGAHGEPDRRDVRHRGEEVRRGDIVVPTGTVVDGMTVAVAASIGLDELDVVRVPRVLILVTGDEVIVSGRPAIGQVRDSVSPALSSLVRGTGGHVAEVEVVVDSAAALAAHLLSSTADLVITTGGTAVGEADCLRQALTMANAEIVIDRVAVRPGGPTVLAALPDGRLVAGLPGNPLAAVTGFLAVVEPALQGLTAARRPPSRQEVLGVDLDCHAGSTHLVPFARIGGLAVPTAWRSSSMLRGLAESEGLLVIPPGPAPAGTSVESLAATWRQ